jgi:hypothetical protein
MERFYAMSIQLVRQNARMTTMAGEVVFERS